MSRNYDYWLAHPNLSVDPIFGHVMTKKENCLKLLQMALPELKLTKIIDISPQKHVSLKLLEKDSRYDIWAVDDQGRKYNIEIQTSSDPKIYFRAWRYLLRLQTTVPPILKKGEKGQLDHATYVLFFCTYDPGEESRAKYSLSMHDDQYVDRVFEDLGHIVFFNTKAPDRSMIEDDMGEFLDLLDGKMKKQPNKFTIKLNNEIQNYINTNEWGGFVDSFKKYKEDLIDEGEKRGEKRGQAQERQNGIKKMIARLRKLSLTDTEIFQSLQEDYGSSFTDEQLQNLLNTTK